MSVLRVRSDAGLVGCGTGRLNHGDRTTSWIVVVYGSLYIMVCKNSLCSSAISRLLIRWCTNQLLFEHELGGGTKEQISSGQREGTGATEAPDIVLFRIELLIVEQVMLDQVV